MKMPSMPIDAEFDVTLHAGRAQIVEPHEVALCLYMDCISTEKEI
jgi:hypothetical protein